MLPDRTQMRLDGIADGARALCGPEQLHIALTTPCTPPCLCCGHRPPLIPPPAVLPHWATRLSLPYEMVRHIVEDAAAMGVERIIYSGGGDPLLYPDLFSVLRETAERGIKITLISNLTLADEETIRRIVSAGVDRLVVSLWAADEEIYSRMHPGVARGSFGRILSLLKAAGRLSPAGRPMELVIMNVICNQNVRQVELMVRLAIEIGASQCWFQPVDVESGFLKHLLLNRAEIAFVIAALNRCSVELQGALRPWQPNLLGFDQFITKVRNSRAEEGIYHSDLIDSLSCVMGWYECRILANGDVVPCCKADRFPLGSVHAQSFRKIWQSAGYAEFRRKAATLSKTDQYFAAINCARCCDDWWLNQDVHRRYREHLAKQSAEGRGGWLRRSIGMLQRRLSGR
ncbi:MAG: radical SAM protein [Chlamydiota bacterium]